MPYNKNKSQQTVARTIRIPKELNDIIENLALKDERDFSKQVIFMLKKYVEIHKSFNITSYEGNEKDAM